MSSEERAVIIGCYLNGSGWEQIAKMFGISEQYVRMIVGEYLAQDFIRV